MAALTRHLPWSPPSWTRALFLAGGIPAQLILPLAAAAPIIARERGAHWQWQGWLLASLLLVGLFFAMPLLTNMQRHRLRATAGVEIAAQPVLGNRGTVPALVAYVSSRATWRQLAYHLLAGAGLAVGALVAVGMWLGGAIYALTYAYAWRLPTTSMLYRGVGSPSSLPRVLDIPVDVFTTIGGIALLLVAPWATAGVAALDAMVAKELLGPSRAEELEHQVEHLAQTRAGVVDAADAERRRLERDLHDGTQQRLVSLAMMLGMARADPADATHSHVVIADAHEQTKAALAELRNLVRGLHPAVLEDRGLDAALSGVAARLPIPVRLTVDVPRRPPPTIEAVAYFVVSEGLSNITKHAQASQAEVFVQRASDRLHIIVSDDGVGGADPARGTGLIGLAKRAESVDGTFEIVSPPGGPTLLTVDLPCAG